MRLFLVACFVLGLGFPAFSNSLVMRGGVAGGEGLVGMCVGVDYVHGGQAVVVSLDWAVNVEGIFNWNEETTQDADRLTALAASWPISRRLPLFLGAGLASVTRANDSRLTQPVLRLTLTSGFNRLVVTQIRLTAAASLGVVADVSLGVGF